MRPRGLGREIEQRADRAAGLLARRSSSTCPSRTSTVITAAGLEIDRDRAVHAAERRRENARRDGRDDAYQPRDADPHRDQREHVEVAVRDRRPAALRRTASPPRARPASRARVGSSSRPAGQASSCRSMRCPPMSSATTGIESASANQRRRVMSTSSALGPVGRGRLPARAPCRRSGSAPGPGLTDLGCIGQV